MLEQPLYTHVNSGQFGRKASHVNKAPIKTVEPRVIGEEIATPYDSSHNELSPHTSLHDYLYSGRATKHAGMLFVAYFLLCQIAGLLFGLGLIYAILTQHPASNADPAKLSDLILAGVFFALIAFFFVARTLKALSKRKPAPILQAIASLFVIFGSLTIIAMTQGVSPPNVLGMLALGYLLIGCLSCVACGFQIYSKSFRDHL